MRFAAGRLREAAATVGLRPNDESLTALLVIDPYDDFIGLIAHTCVEATVRHAVELGYQVTMVRAATADYSDKEMRAALDVNIPSYASAMVTANERVDAIAAVGDER